MKALFYQLFLFLLLTSCVSENIIVSENKNDENVKEVVKQINHINNPFLKLNRIFDKDYPVNEDIKEVCFKKESCKKKFLETKESYKSIFKDGEIKAAAKILKMIKNSCNKRIWNRKNLTKDLNYKSCTGAAYALNHIKNDKADNTLIIFFTENPEFLKYMLEINYGMEWINHRAFPEKWKWNLNIIGESLTKKNIIDIHRILDSKGNDYSAVKRRLDILK